ncbi:cytochrome c [Akkermansiaceae bacterium]|nr:cytochrome c [Akkermansiaceae bacterium]
MIKAHRFVSFCLMLGGMSWAAPVVLGLHGKHPLDDAQKGHLLANELRCAACHEGMSDEGMKAAPDLKSVGSRLSTSYLKKFIANPAATHPGTTMPDMLAGLPLEEKKRVSESISHYLSLLTSDAASESKKSTFGSAKLGKKVYHEIGCVACHSPRDEVGKELSLDGVVSLAHLPGKHQAGALAEFLADPLAVRPSGRMPDMNLSQKEAADLAAYLEAGVVHEEEAVVKDRVKEGRENFRKFNCHSCHEVEEPNAKFGPALAKMNFTNGCLSAEPESAPDYELNEGQRKSLRVVYEPEKVAKFSAADQLKMKLTQLNCIACHERDDFGGVSTKREAFFSSTEEALGNEARIPPPLSQIGAKLRPGWLAKVLFEGKRIRPYMTTRMPHYGDDALAGMAKLFDELDQAEEVVLKEPTRETKPMVNNGGHLLLGDKGLNCIACHNYNGKESPGMKGLDLATSFQRLEPGWFYHFMQNPGAHRPGIIMPNSWPDGKAVQTDILGGDTHAQLEALWFQFSLGRSARDPSGLRSEPSKLIVGDKVQVYRGRSKVAGYRGIAVGFPGPEGLNYAFNAQNGALTAIWQGEFVTANWRSQGAGDFKPASPSIALAQDVAFLQLKDETEPWPLYQVTTKENPVNPDPLYPKNHGYAFKGYHFDRNGNPTLMYRCGEIAIEEKSEAVEQKVLRRVFFFDSPAKTEVFFRALTGKVESISSSIFTDGELKITIAGQETKLRNFGDEGAEQEKELLIKLNLPEGKSTFTIDYELLR